ncbi:putative rhomboid protease [Helianthus anomalus]
MQNLLSFNRHHPTTVSPPRYHRPACTHYTTFPQPSRRRVSCNVLFKPKVSSCNLLAHHAIFRSTRAESSRRNFLFNQPTSYQRTWQIYSTGRLTSVDGVVKGLILTNVVVYLLWKVADINFMIQNFTIQWDNIKGGRYHTMITSAFSHKNLKHIVSNMITLYSFGKSIGQRVGPEFLLALYLVGAFGGSVSYLVHRASLATSSNDNQLSESDRSNAAALGASGAVNAILMLYILLYPMKTLLVEVMIPVPALLAVNEIFTVFENM